MHIHRNKDSHTLQKRQQLHVGKMVGNITLILGPMFSGKSTELLRLVRRQVCAKMRCLVVRHSSAAGVSFSHDDDDDDGQHMSQPLPCRVHVAAQLEELPESVLATVDVIGIDQGHLFERLAPFCELWANRGKCVIVAALDGTSRRESFPFLRDLVPLAESVQKLRAVCYLCSQEASFTVAVPTPSSSSSSSSPSPYAAVCRRCYFAVSHQGVAKDTC